jgi:hypothetical protein
MLNVIFDIFSDKCDVQCIIFSALKRERAFGFHYLLFNNTSIESISPTDYEKYVLIVSRLFSSTITLEDLNTLYWDIAFLQKLFESLYKKDDAELRGLLKIILNQNELIHIFESSVIVLQTAEYKQEIDIETKKAISSIEINLFDIVKNILAMLARASSLGSLSFAIVLFCKKLFDAVFKNTQLKNYHFDKDTERNLLCRLSDSICYYFLNMSSINYSLLPAKEKAPFKYMVQSLTNRSFPLQLFFLIYPLDELQCILAKDDIELTGSDLIAIRVFYLIALNILASTSEALPHTIQNLYLPRRIQHLQLDDKHYLIERKNEVEIKLELFYGFSK